MFPPNAGFEGAARPLSKMLRKSFEYFAPQGTFNFTSALR